MDTMKDTIDMRNRSAFEQHNMRQNDISWQIKDLESEIRIKSSTGDWQEYYYGEGAPKPYNYEEVSVLERRLWNAQEELQRFPSGLTISTDNVLFKRTEIEKKLFQLKRAKYYRPEDIRALAEKANDLLQKARQQTKIAIVNEALNKIKEIESLVQSDPSQAISLLTTEQDWHIKQGSFRATLSNFDESYKLFEEKRKEAAKKEARELLETVKQQTNIAISEATKNKIEEIESLVLSDPAEAIRILTTERDWHVGQDSFRATLLNFEDSYNLYKEKKAKIAEASMLLHKAKQQTSIAISEATKNKIKEIESLVLSDPAEAIRILTTERNWRVGQDSFRATLLNFDESYKLLKEERARTRIRRRISAVVFSISVAILVFGIFVGNEIAESIVMICGYVLAGVAILLLSLPIGWVFTSI